MSSSLRTSPMCALIAVAVVSGACTRSSGPHIFDENGVAQPELEPAWVEVERFAGDATPRSVTIVMTDDGISRFDGKTRRLLLDRANLARRGNSLAAHELMHVAAYALSNGASDDEPFRFIDEGLAKLVEQRVIGDVDDYERHAHETAARAFADPAIDLVAMQRWSTFFGGPKSGRWWTYDVGASFCFFVIERYGGDATLRALLVDVGRTHDLDASLRSVVGVDASTIEREWRNDVCKRAHVDGMSR